VSLLEVCDLTVRYAGAAEPPVRKLGFSIEAGESLGLVGESGSGKTQTALAIMGLLPPGARIDGSISFDGFALSNQSQRVLAGFRGRRIGMVFQDPQQALNPYLPVGEQLRRVLLEHKVAPAATVRALALDLITRVRLPEAERVYRSFPHQLSGGMRQRAMIALALSCSPRLLIADEPTTSLDVTVQAEVLELLQELRADSGIALLLITHDLGVIAENCERMLVMHRGRMLEQGHTVKVFHKPRHPETVAMLAAAVRLEHQAPPPPPLPSPEPVLRVESLSISYSNPVGARDLWSRRPSRSVVREVNFSLFAAETLAVVGESGCGKSSLAKAVVGLVAADQGGVYLGDTRLAARVRDRSAGERRSLQMVFQDPVASLSPAMSIANIIAEPLALHEPALTRSLRQERVASILDRTGLDRSLLERFPHELSGGQAQRVAIARALVLDPAVIVCDEAVAALDGTVRRAVLELLLEEQERSGLSLVFISHDMGVVRQVAHRVLVMYMGRVVELADNERLFYRPRHPYTRSLIDAVPVADPERRRSNAGGGLLPAGEVPQSRYPESRGCPFHPRCKYALPICRSEMPALRLVEGAEVACHRAEELDLRNR
jgi:peptide/nickel transport system ATP-binding protein